jgi:hypothetical protein
VDSFSEKFDALKSNFERVIFELLNFVYLLRIHNSSLKIYGLWQGWSNHDSRHRLLLLVSSRNIFTKTFFLNELMYIYIYAYAFFFFFLHFGFPYLLIYLVAG